MEMKNREVIKNFLQEMEEKAADCRQLWEQFSRCFLNTLETTMKIMDDGTVHVITGDIPAMWLRDSTAQIRPFLFLAKEDEEMRKLAAGLVRRQFFYITLDPYANAFNDSPNGACWEKDDPEPSPWVWERKFEVDSCVIHCSLPGCCGKIPDVRNSSVDILQKGRRRFWRYSG